MNPLKKALWSSLASLFVAGAAAAQQSYLLIPDTGGDRIAAFDATTGALVNLNFIPKDGRMKQVVQVVQTPWNTLLMTDFEANSIWEYGLNGQYIQTFVDTAQMGFPTAPGVSRGLQGICIAYGKIWFTVNDVIGTGSDNRNAIWSVEFDGTGLQQLVTAVNQPALGQVRGIAPYDGGFLVADSGDSSDDDIEFVSLNGTVMTPCWHDSTIRGSYMSFPQQVTPTANGSVLVATFSSATVFEIDGASRNVSNFALPNPGLSLRGVHPLDSGEWLACGGTKVIKMDPIGGATTEIVNVITATYGVNGSFRWISRVDIQPCFGDLDGSGEVDQGDVAFALLDYGPCPGCAGDLDGSGDVDFGDVALILLSVGPCS
jgi:hypothetical protein